MSKEMDVEPNKSQLSDFIKEVRENFQSAGKPKQSAGEPKQCWLSSLLKKLFK